MNKSFEETLQRIRDYFLHVGDPVKVEKVNDMLTQLDEANESFSLTLPECISLMRFFYSVGYISREFHDDVHVIATKMETWLDNHDPSKNVGKGQYGNDRQQDSNRRTD